MNILFDSYYSEFNVLELDFTTFFCWVDSITFDIAIKTIQKIKETFFGSK